MKKLLRRLKKYGHLFCLLIFIQNINAQTTLSFDKDPALSVFSKIAEVYDVTLAFEVVQFEQMLLSGTVTNLPVKKALQKLLESKKTEILVLSEKYIVLRRSISIETQSQQASGYVRDASDNLPLPFATIVNYKLKTSAITDENGFFEITVSDKEIDTLEFKYLGYEDLIITTNNFTNNSAVSMKRKAFEIHELQIVDQSIRLLNVSDDGNGYNMYPNQMSALPGFGETDVLRMVQLLPGVRATDESASNLSIRGSSADQNLVTFDGIPVYHTGHFFGMQSSFNPNIVKNVKIYKDGYGAQLGGRVAGIIDINSLPTNTEQFRVKLGLNLLDTHFGIYAPLFKKKTMLMVAGRRSYTDIFNNFFYSRLLEQVAFGSRIQTDQNETLEELETVDANSKFFYSDLNAKWLIKPNDRDVGYFSFVMGRDKLSYQSSLLEEGNEIFKTTDGLEIKNIGTAFSWHNNWSIKHNTQWKFHLSSFDSDYNFQYDDEESEENEGERITNKNKLREIGLKAYHIANLNKYYSLSGGYQFTHYDVSYSSLLENFRDDFTENSNQKEQTTIQSLFVDHLVKPIKYIEFNVGLRYSHYAVSQQHFVEPRLTINLYPKEQNLKIYGSVGWHRQFVSQFIEQNELGLGNELWTIANEEENEINVIQARQIAGGVSYKKNNFLFDLQIYNKQLRNLRFLTLGDSDTQTDETVSGKGKASGLEVLIKQRWKRIFGLWISYTFSKTIHQSTELNNGLSFRANNDKPHHLKIAANFSFKNWESGFIWNVESGNVYTQAVSIETIIDEDGESLNTINFDVQNGQRLPAFHRLDFSTHYKFVLKKKPILFKIGASILNLYNSSGSILVRYLITETNDDELQLRRYEKSQLGILPNFFLKMEI